MLPCPVVMLHLLCYICVLESIVRVQYIESIIFMPILPMIICSLNEIMLNVDVNRIQYKKKLAKYKFVKIEKKNRNFQF